MSDDLKDEEVNQNDFVNAYNTKSSIVKLSKKNTNDKENTLRSAGNSKHE
jgi:hypothetical protein